MAISEKEFKVEEKILKKTHDLLGEVLSSLGEEVYQDEDNLVEFKKMMWEDANSFDAAEAHQVMAATALEAEKTLQKQRYFQKLNQIKNKPYFASIVFKDEEGQIFNIYISLTYLKDKDANNILYDWRSPICSLFYDYEVGPCSYNAPGGVVKGELKRKRQYKIEKSKLLGVFDNSLNIDDEVLQDVLSQDTSGKMQNVVNTIQQEQNKVIRDLENNTLIVQGIAGSGKTTVALHRIAFLLYRLKNLNSNNILIFSPNNIFTDYISDVLPSLGEANTLQTTFNDYLSYFITEYENVEDFATFLSRYYTHQNTNDQLIKYKQSDEIITDLDEYLDDYIASCKFEKDIIENEVNFVSRDDLNKYLTYKYDRFPLFERVEEIANKLSEEFYKGSRKKVKTFIKLLNESSNFKKNYKEIYKDFFTSKYCRLALTTFEIDEFIDKKIINYEDALLFSYVKGTLEGFPYEVNIKQVVIDEAQDYNKLQYIIINKIFQKADFTILGDINQNINPYYNYKSLNDLAPLFRGDVKYLELLKTYRSTKEIVDYTNKILNLTHVNAIRKDTNKPIVFRRNVTDLQNSILKDITHLQDEYKSTAIITKDNIQAKKLYDLLKDNINISLITEETKKFRKDLVIVPAYLSKGLEFDSVIIYSEKSNAYQINEKHLLYVACTRCQHELYIYNNEKLS